MSAVGLKRAQRKMEVAGVGQAAIDLFADYYRQLEAGGRATFGRRTSLLQLFPSPARTEWQFLHVPTCARRTTGPRS